MYEPARVLKHDDGCGFVHSVHVCPQLGSKPKMPRVKPDLVSRPRGRDVLAGPFGAGEHILDLPDGFRLVNNLFSIMPEQFMMVATEWRSQTEPLTPEALALAFEVVCSYTRHGRRAAVFFK